MCLVEQEIVLKSSIRRTQRKASPAAISVLFLSQSQGCSSFSIQMVPSRMTNLRKCCCLLVNYGNECENNSTSSPQVNMIRSSLVPGYIILAKSSYQNCAMPDVSKQSSYRPGLPLEKL